MQTTTVIGVIDEILDIILDRCADLVAARHEMTEAELAVGHQRREHIRAQAAALRHDRHRARTQGPRERTAIGRKAGFHADEAEAVRPADAHTPVGERTQPRGPVVSVSAFAEARGEHDGRGDAARVRFLENIAGRIGGDRDHEAIDRSGQVAHGGKALVAQHVRVARVHRKNLAGKAAVAQVGDDIGPASAALGGAHDRNGLGIEQRTHGFHHQRAFRTAAIAGSAAASSADCPPTSRT
jgi:hypothetical protein